MNNIENCIFYRTIFTKESIRSLNDEKDEVIRELNEVITKIIEKFTKILEQFYD